MKFTELNKTARLVLLSATMPNVDEIADWVSYTLTGRDTMLLRSKYRPCPLYLHYEEYFDGEKTYDDNEQQKVNTALEIIDYYPEDKFLVFSHTKRTGALMKKTLDNVGIRAEFHSADLGKDKRIKLEKDFKEKKDPRVLVATSTLAWGCYKTGSPIQMSDDTFGNVEDLEVGDLVKSFDGTNFVASKVLRTEIIKDNKGLKFTLISGQTCEVNLNHLFCCMGKDGTAEYATAEFLTIKDCLAVPSAKGLSFEKIESIEFTDGGEFVELEVSGSHNYIGCGILSHNCNMPARRVIILGIHRGIDEVATYDVGQMVGRAGRPAYDPVGDAYILLPQKEFDLQKARLKNQQNIVSQMLQEYGGNYKTLAFHLVSEIYQGNIEDANDVHHWYKRSLACFQSQDFDDTVVIKTLDLLKKCGAIWEEDGKLTATSVGKVASLFYYSPFDVSDLKKNFKFLIEGNYHNDDYMVALALGNIDTHRCGIVSRAEREAMIPFDTKVTAFLGKGKIMDPAIKASCAYHNLLSGTNNDALNGIMRQVQFDFPRTHQVLNALDGFTGNWKMKDWFNKLQLRIAYGVKPELVYLCQLPEVGKVRAQRLYSAGLRNPKDLIGNEAKAQRLLGFKEDKMTKVMEEVRKLVKDTI